MRVVAIRCSVFPSLYNELVFGDGTHAISLSVAKLNSVAVHTRRCAILPVPAMLDWDSLIFLRVLLIMRLRLGVRCIYQSGCAVLSLRVALSRRFSSFFL